MSTPTPITYAFFNRKPSGRSFLHEVKETMTQLETDLAATRAELEAKSWRKITEDPESLPPMGEIVWLCEQGRGIWVGSREDDADGWLWGNTYGNYWHNGQKWDGDCEQDDDYRPTHWMRLPEPAAALAGKEGK
jgi:hypothetical protein